MPACPVCATENPDVARFCLSCGASLVAEPAREERKVVTVLFADLVGFTSRAEQLDPEDVRAVLAPYWERLRTELERRGGTVEKFIGDAVMALFGAPVAHEDDPLRAVGAALAIRDWAREEADVQVRIAVNTGEALVLLGARPAEGEGMAAGDVVNTAARLQAAAPVNGVLVGETTYRATRDVIEYAECEPVVAKGKSDPVPAWEAVQVRARIGMDVERATSPLVGRTRELGVIVDAFERARAEREPQLVNLVGVPGIGKSRLVAELFARLEDDPELVWWRQGRALPYGEGVSYWALAEMVKAQAGIDENDDAETAAAKLRESVDAVVDEDERAWVLDHLRPLVGAERGSSDGESAPPWRRYLEGLAEQRPLVLVFEDMHWANDGLLDFIDHLVDWATGVPLLVIATARPELLDRRPAWGGGKLNVSTIALTPLSDEESAAIIHGVLERSALPADTQRALVDRAGGNPLYAEQFARLYLERGSAEDLPLPENVQALIAARIDGLAAEEKRLLQVASVHGKVFWAGALAGDDVELTLHALERKGMLRRERRSAVGGQTQYAFRHVLVRDVAYGQIPRASRGERHVEAADWIEAHGRSDDHVELVAHHLLTAHRLGAGPPERVRDALRRAGERAYALGAYPSAHRYFEEALALAPDGDPQLLAARARAGFRASGDLEGFTPALDALEQAGLREEAAELASFAANAYWHAAQHDRAQKLLERGERLLEGLPRSPALAAVLAEAGRLALFQGDYDGSRALLARARPLAKDLGLDELRAETLVTEATAKTFEGDLEAARRFHREALELAPPLSRPAFRALANLAVVEWLDGDLAAWERAHAAAFEHATRTGNQPNIRWLHHTAVGHLAKLGRWDEALRGIDEYLAGEASYNDSAMLLHKGNILGSRGDLDGARACRDEVLALATDMRDGQNALPARIGGAWISLLVGDEDRARALVEEAWPLARAVRYRAPGVNVESILTMLYAGRREDWLAHHRGNARTRRVVAAELLLEGRSVEAAEAWARISPDDEAHARLHAARDLVAAGRHTDADVQLQRGLAYFRAVGATRIVQQAAPLLGAAAAAE